MLLKIYEAKCYAMSMKIITQVEGFLEKGENDMKRL
jgi:hypothetical protein